jgi:integrase
MAVKFTKLTRAGVKSLEAGKSINEHGISATKLKNGDVRWVVNLMVDGRRIHRAIGLESAGVKREQCEEAIETLRTHAREQRLNLPKARKIAPSFREAAVSYIARLVEEGGKGIPRKEQHLKTRLIPFFGGSRLDAVTTSDTQRFARQRQAEGAQPGTINRELATLSHMLRSASRWRWLTKDQVPEIARLREGAGRVIALSPDQCRALLEGAIADQDPDLWLFVLICLQTSMRHGEARRLRWEHYDSHRRRFYIPEAKAGDREQPIPADLATTLDRLQAERGVKEGYLFKGGNGSASGYRHTFRKAFQRAALRAGLNPAIITPHVLRHTAITKLVKAGVDLPTVQRVSGHRTLAMVLRYAHVDGHHVDGAVDHLRL